MPRRGGTLWVVSNGYGEDTIAAGLLRALMPRVPDWSFAAIPIVGEGRALADVGVPVLGPRRRLPGGGFTLHHPSVLWADLRAGLLSVTGSQIALLAGGRADAVLVVGDIYAQALASLVRGSRRFVVQPLVSVRMAEGGGRVAWNRTFMERIRAPERMLLRRAEAVYPRDEATAAWLRAHGVPLARFLGNPMMDGLAAQPLPGSRPGATVALLPGSRAFAETSLLRMLAALECLAEGGDEVVAWVPWTRGAVPPPPPGWRSEASEGEAVWSHRRVRVGFVPGRFAEALASADAVLGTAGTAHEQAAGLGLPVVAFPVEPAYDRGYLANQRRLLGDALEVATGGPEDVARALRRALHDPARRAGARSAGSARMGPSGGTDAIASDLADRLNAAGSARP